MIRAFLAVEIGADLRDRIARVQTDLRRRIEEAGQAGPERGRLSWTSPATIHLTLKFFGHLDPAMADPIRIAVARAVAGFQPMALPLERIGVFPGARDPRVLWLGPSASWETSAADAALRSLHGGIERACAALGLDRDDRPLRPHLTIARIRSLDARAAGVLVTATPEPLDLGSISIDHVTLFSSRLDAGGATHTPLWRLGLAGGRQDS